MRGGDVKKKKIMRRGNVERKKNEKRRKTMKRTDIEKKKYWEDKI